MRRLRTTHADAPHERDRLDPLGTPTSESAAAAADGLWATLSLAGVPCAVIGPDTTVVWANATMGETLGVDSSHLVGQPLGLTLGATPGDRIAGPIAALARHGKPVQRLALTRHLPDGTPRLLHLSGARTEAWAVPGHAVVLAESATPAGAVAVSTRTDAVGSGDALTGLPNRATFETLLVSALRDAATTRQPFALLVCDLDGFRRLNQTLGPGMGDQVLRWVAERLTATLHHHDTMGRLGGDEFVIIAERVPNLDTAKAVGRRLADSIDEPVAGTEIGNLSMCVGITLATGRERPTDLLAEADRALQFARVHGPGSVATLQEVIDATAATGTFASHPATPAPDPSA